MTGINKGRDRWNGATPSTARKHENFSATTSPAERTHQKYFSHARAFIKMVIVRAAVWGVIPAGFATWLIQRGGMKDA